MKYGLNVNGLELLLKGILLLTVIEFLVQKMSAMVANRIDNWINESECKKKTKTKKKKRKDYYRTVGRYIFTIYPFISELSPLHLIFCLGDPQWNLKLFTYPYEQWANHTVTATVQNVSKILRWTFTDTDYGLRYFHSQSIRSEWRWYWIQKNLFLFRIDRLTQHEWSS